uniref:Transposase n=1 Tax=Tapinoma nigerrimum TaxID=81627 RepID=M1VT21_9HYME|nr:transposase [Tapinoma nigerrimum]
MSSFVPENVHLRHALLFLFHQKKKAAESHRLLVETYGEHAPTIRTCETWFRQFKCGDFNVQDKERPGRPKTFEDAELQELLDEDSTQTQKQLAEKLNVSRVAICERLQAMGKIQKMGRWVPHELNDRQMENRKIVSEMLLQRYERKSFLHRIVTGDEKWIYFENPKRKKSWLSPGEAGPSTARPNRFGRKTMLCVWWDQIGVVYYELLKPGETVNTDRYRQQMINLNCALIERRPQYAQRHDKVILQHDNAPSHTAKPVKEMLKSLGWEVLSHPPYSPDLAPSDYHLFASMGHALAEQHFADFEEVKKWLDEWFSSKEKLFFWNGIHKLSERWTKCIESNGQYFE